MLGKLFDDGRGRLRDESGEDGEGEQHRPRFDIDLDAGVVRLPTLHPAEPSTPEEDGETPR